MAPVQALTPEHTSATVSGNSQGPKDQWLEVQQDHWPNLTGSIT